MRAIKITPNIDEPITVIEVEKDYREMAKVIGGPCLYIERFRCPLTRFGLVGVVDEDGQHNGQRINTRTYPLYPVPGYYLRGTVLVMAEGMTPDGPDFVDLPNPQVALDLVTALLEGTTLREEAR